MGVTAQSLCDESFESLLQRCRRGRGFREMWKNTIFPEHPVEERQSLNAAFWLAYQRLSPSVWARWSELKKHFEVFWTCRRLQTTVGERERGLLLPSIGFRGREIARDIYSVNSTNLSEPTKWRWWIWQSQCWTRKNELSHSCPVYQTKQLILKTDNCPLNHINHFKTSGFIQSEPVFLLGSNFSGSRSGFLNFLGSGSGFSNFLGSDSGSGFQIAPDSDPNLVGSIESSL